MVDHGHGVASAHIDRLFDPFFTTKEHGTGLGLPVAHQIVRQMGGSLLAQANTDTGNDVLGGPARQGQKLMNPARILVVDDDENLRWVLQTQLEQMGYSAITAANGAAALEAIDKEPPALVLTDLKMPGISGMELLEQIRRDYPEIPVVIITAFGTIQSAVQAMRSGAYDYLTKPIDYDELGLAVNRVLEHFRLVQEVKELRASLDRKYGFENIIGHSDALLSLLDTAARAAQSNSTILIHAETGTGKELLARAIHFNSRRRDKPFVTINCGAIPRDLLESELFGHVKGSFTGAMAHKAGKVELADRGTLFLDEIGEMPGDLQVKVLRLIQQGELEKVGATSPVKIDVRFVAATHRNLRAMIEDGDVSRGPVLPPRSDSVGVAAFRDRGEDIPELVQHFFLKAKAEQGRPDLVLPPDCCRDFRIIAGPVTSASWKTSSSGSSC